MIHALALAGMLSGPAAGAAPPGWAALERETATHLRELVRIRTVNPPGNERAACEYLAAVLAKEGVAHEVVESTPGRANLVARLPGDGSRKPILLLAHLDTVGVEPARWSFPPFSGEEKDGYILGRGAIDDKSMAAAFLTALVQLKREGVKLKRDLVFAATADEESGGRWGVRWLLERRPELLSAEYALNEGGTTLVRDDTVRLVAIQTLEKSYYDLRLTARGAGGHASVPHPANAIHALARALGRVASWEPAPRLNPVTREFFSGVLRLEIGETAAALRDLLSEEPERLDRAGRALRAHPYYAAMLQDTVVPTMVSGGVRENVTPSSASANLNARLLPDTEPAEFLERLSALLDEPGSGLAVEAEPAGPALEPMPRSGPFYEALGRAARRLFPEAVIVPSMSVGSTDAEFLRRAGVKTYGIEFPVSLADEARIHGHDERMPLKGLGLGTRLVVEILREAAL